MAHKNIHLVIIDPQNDFCDLPDSHCPPLPDRPGERHRPALPVPGAHRDMQRIAALIRRGGGGLQHISVTLDSHQSIDIAHPGFWKTGDGSPVAAFTAIEVDDVRSGRYRPRDPAGLARVTAYLDALQAKGRYRHMVWPLHCQIGSWGHNIHDDVQRACSAWEDAGARAVNHVLKGRNPWTEHYSAIQAEVPDSADETTQTNSVFVAALRQADRVLICGEAGSHCVRATTEHLLDHFSGSERRKLLLLTDCISPVSGFTAQYAAFIDTLRQRGVNTATSDELLPDLLANTQ